MKYNLKHVYNKSTIEMNSKFSKCESSVLKLKIHTNKMCDCLGSASYECVNPYVCKWLNFGQPLCLFFFLFFALIQFYYAKMPLFMPFMIIIIQFTTYKYNNNSADIPIVYWLVLICLSIESVRVISFSIQQKNNNFKLYLKVKRKSEQKIAKLLGLLNFVSSRNT